MEIRDIRKLIDLIDQSTIDEFTYEQGEEKISLKRNRGAGVPSIPVSGREEKASPSVPTETSAKSAPAPKEAPEKSLNEQQKEENLHKIVSPMVGTFYTSSSPEAGNYVKVGDQVQADTVVCIVEAMKLFNEIEADLAGEIVEVHAENGELVEYGQPLFSVKPA